MCVSARLQPFYGIDRTAVDTDFQVENRRTGRRCTDARDLTPALDRVTSTDRHRLKVAVQRIGIGTVVNDDEVTEAGEGIGERDGARMDHAYQGALEGRDFNSAADGRIAQAGRRLSEERGHAAGDGPIERTTKRRQRNGYRRCRTTDSEVRHLCLQSLVRNVQLTGELRVEISLSVDLRDERSAGRERARGSSLRLSCCSFSRS